MGILFLLNPFTFATQAAADNVSTIEQHSMNAFADALDVIPICLAENSGLSAIATVAEVSFVVLLFF